MYEAPFYPKTNNPKLTLLAWQGLSACLHVGVLIAVLLSRDSHHQVTKMKIKPAPSTITLEADVVPRNANAEIVLPAPPVKLERQVERHVIAKPHVAAKPVQVAEAKVTKEKLVDSFQPESIPAGRPVDDRDHPEELSPVISDDVATPPAAAEEPQPSEVKPSETTATEPNKNEGEEVGSPKGGAIVDASARRPLAGNPLPQYPQADRFAGKQGTAVITAHVGRDGLLSDVQIEKSSGSKSLDSASLAAFSKWRFAPGPEANVRKAFAFALQGQPKTLKARIGSLAVH